MAEIKEEGEAMKPGLAIVIPSRKRPDNIKHLLPMLPTAFILVDAAEESAYAPIVPKAQLLLHPGLDRISKIRNFALKARNEECVVMIDDDLNCVRALVGRAQRKIVEPDAILAILHSAYNCTRDLGVSLFCFCRDARWAVMKYLPHDPLSLNGPAAGAFGVVGRKVKFDETLVTREDIDLAMQSLMRDRIILHDRRFYFDFGRTWCGAGGNQGRRTKANESADLKAMKERWGAYVAFSNAEHGENTAMSVRVPRKDRELADLV